MTLKLDELIPQDETWEFKDRKGNIHIFKMFVPFALSVRQAEIGKRKGKLDGNTLQLATLEELLKPQHDFMDGEWIAENISLPHQNFIYASVIKKINEGAEAILKTPGTGKEKKKIFSRSKW